MASLVSVLYVVGVLHFLADHGGGGGTALVTVLTTAMRRADDAGVASSNGDSARGGSGFSLSLGLEAGAGTDSSSSFAVTECQVRCRWENYTYPVPPLLRITAAGDPTLECVPPCEGALKQYVKRAQRLACAECKDPHAAAAAASVMNARRAAATQAIGVPGVDKQRRHLIREAEEYLTRTAPFRAAFRTMVDAGEGGGGGGRLEAGAGAGAGAGFRGGAAAGGAAAGGVAGVGAGREGGLGGEPTGAGAGAATVGEGAGAGGGGTSTSRVDELAHGIDPSGKRIPRKGRHVAVWLFSYPNSGTTWMQQVSTRGSTSDG